MGRATTEPVIERCELTLTDEQATTLASSPLAPLPYFGAFTTTPTLTQFFEATGQTRAAFVPASLEGLLAHPPEARRGFHTHAEPSADLSSVVVIWRSDEEWYVDEVFHRVTAVDLTALPVGRCTEVGPGTMQAFRRLAPLVTVRRTEGLAGLQHPDARVDLSAPLLELQRTPGLPNTTSWTVKAYADGRYEVSLRSPGAPVRSRPDRGLAPLALSGFFLRAMGLVEEPLRAAPTPRSDGQETLLTVRVGRQQRFTLRAAGPAVTALATDVMRAFELP
jgi:hypothetical protein